MSNGRPVRVAIISPTFGRFGGIESFIFALVAELKKHPQVEVSICFERLKPGGVDELIEKAIREAGVPTTIVPRGSPKVLRAIWEADVVHAQNPRLSTALAAKLLGRAVAITIYNWRRPGNGPAMLSRRAAVALADRPWYISDFVWDTWEPAGRRGKSGKMPIVSKLPEGMVEPSRRRGFIFVARLVPHKGMEELLDAYEGAGLDPEKWPLTIVGDGPLRAGLDERLRRKPIAGVRLTGAVETEDRNEMVRCAKWMVTPPNTREDLGLTPIEARHVGVPCIVTRDGGVPEAAGKHALICEPGDVEGLRALLRRAAAMPEPEYEELSRRTRAELLEYLRPLSDYVGAYLELAGRRERRQSLEPAGSRAQ